MSTSIAEAADAMVELVKPIVEGRASLSIGGKISDPTMNKVQTPCAWIVYEGDSNLSTRDVGECSAMLRSAFIVQVIIDYAQTDDLVNNQYPVLEAVIGAVAGKDVYQWKYEGQALRELDDKRLVYTQRYTTNLAVTP